ncbi:MAG: exopolysaccharide biosynthesis polyprenyl glycosylphosphotransferase [Dolichospermum sp.]
MTLVESKPRSLSNLLSKFGTSRWLILIDEDHVMKFVHKFLADKPSQELVIITENSDNITDILYLKETETQITYGGNLSNLPEWSQQSWSGVILGTQTDLQKRETESLMQMRLKGIPVYRLPDIWEALYQKVPPSLLEDEWFTFSSDFRLVSSYIHQQIKRFTDIIVTILLFILLFPLMVLVGLMIKLDSPGPIFYSQLRTGLNGKPFLVYKFRSMYQEAEKQGAQWATQRDPRITRVGHWLRLLRIDELPQLWNVLRSEMSLIGPRPERPEFDVKLKEAIPYYELRYLVKPGITGWAQVLYPYGASVEDAYEKLSYDIYYLKNYSLWLDLVIAFKTIKVVLLGKGR